MSDYTVEELERMLNEAREIEMNRIIRETPEQIEEKEIKDNFDVENQIIMSQDGYNTIISNIWKSQSLNKILINNYIYEEEMENNKVVGRCCMGYNRLILQYNDEIPEQTIQVINQRQIDRTI